MEDESEHEMRDSLLVARCSLIVDRDRLYLNLALLNKNAAAGGRRAIDENHHSRVTKNESRVTSSY
jgi:hypothetical protein